MTGRVVSINISSGGVPKLPVESAIVTREGLIGDWQNDRKHHGGPERAVSVYAIEMIRRLQAEGHPIAPGTAGENLTLEGFEWANVLPGAKLVFEGGVELEVVSYCAPCKTIKGSFADGDFGRISQKVRPGESRLYARVVREGQVITGESVTLG